MDWVIYALVFAAFFLSHSLPLRPAVRGAIEARIGARGFSLAYSAVSLAVLVWLIVAAGRAPYVPLWDPAPWQNWLALAAMLAVCVILGLSIARPNPFSFGGGREARFDPAHPGLVRWMRHPLLVALALWSVAHTLANGDLAHVLLFGTFLGFALVGTRLVDRRKRRALGADWPRLRDEVRRAPLPGMGMGGVEICLRLGAGLGLYLGLIALHPLALGISPLP